MKTQKYKQINKSDNLSDKLLDGVNLIADTVKITLGPRGQLVGIAKPFGSQHLTKDGISVAREISSPDSIENFAINVVREASLKSAIDAGDGTTSVLVLTQALYKNGLEEIKNGRNSTELNKILNNFAETATRYIKDNAIKVDQADIKRLTDIATISANGDREIGKQIAEIISKIGARGVITMEPSNTLGIGVEFVEGLEVDSGFVSQYFINQQKPESILESPLVLVTTKKINSFLELSALITPLLQKNGALSLVIVADEVDGEALRNLIANHQSPEVPLKVCVIKAPGSQGTQEAFLQDICKTTGAILVDDIRSSGFTKEVLGHVKKFKATKDKSIFIANDNKTEQIQDYVKKLKLELSDLKADYDRSRLEQRIAKLSSGVAIIKVGASTEVESQELRDRLDDSIRATQSALEEGYLPGGGAGYLDLVTVTKELFIQKALAEPQNQILFNGGLAIVIEDPKKHKQGFGINVTKSDKLVNMITEGIIDPAKVIRNAIQNSVSVVSKLLQTKAVITNEEK